MHRHPFALAIVAAAILSSTSISARPAAYDNTLTGLIPDLFAGLDVVSRELVGFIPAVSRDSSAERAAVNEAVKYHIAPPTNIVDITPAMTIPEPDGQTIGYDSVVITKSKAAEFGFVGEEQKALNNGPGYVSVQADMFAQAVRGLCNLIEIDLAAAAIAGASRSSGIAGTTPFATTLGDSAQTRKILDDNGAPASDRSLIINTATGASLRTLSQLTKANEAGTTMTAQQGTLMNLHNFNIGESAQLVTHTKGTGASGTTNTAGYAKGITSIVLAAAGTGTIVSGDVLVFAGDANKYVVVTGVASLAAGGTVTIAQPGLRQAIPASATNVTLEGTYSPNVGFVRSAIVLASRAPALPQEGDAAMERRLITDPRSGMTFEVSIYGGYRKVRYEVAIAWGVKVTKSAHIALLEG